VGLKFRFGLDDSLDVVGVHLVGGIIGTVLIGFLSTAAAPGGIDGLFYGGGWKSLGDQAGAAGFTILWTGILTTVIAFAIKYTIGWRVAEEGEVEGIDSDQHGETAYDLHTGLGGGALTSTSVLAASTAAPALKNEGANA
jgi:Amt family ammonium transporter